MATPFMNGSTIHYEEARNFWQNFHLILSMEYYHHSMEHTKSVLFFSNFFGLLTIYLQRTSLVTVWPTLNRAFFFQPCVKKSKQFCYMKVLTHCDQIKNNPTQEARSNPEIRDIIWTVITLMLLSPSTRFTCMFKLYQTKKINSKRICLIYHFFIFKFSKRLMYVDLISSHDTWWKSYISLVL